MMKLTGKARSVVLSAKTPMLIQLRNDRIMELTHLAIAKATNPSKVAFHEVRIDSLSAFIAKVEAMTDTEFKTFVKEHGHEIF
jgi:hypothetical protein